MLRGPIYTYECYEYITVKTRGRGILTESFKYIDLAFDFIQPIRYVEI